MRSIIYLALIFSIQSVYISLDKQKAQCFFKQMIQEQQLTLSYVISGNSEDQIQFQVYYQNEEIFQLSHQKDYSYDLIAKQKGEYAFCFKNLDGQNKILAFDMLENDQNIKNKIVTKDDLDITLSSFQENYLQLEKIHTNQNFQDIRESTHSKCSFIKFKVIEEIEQKIKNCSLIKILVLFMVSAVQIKIILDFFKNKSNQAV